MYNFNPQYQFKHILIIYYYYYGRTAACLCLAIFLCGFIGNMLDIRVFNGIDVSGIN